MIQWSRRGFVRFFLPSRRKDERSGRLHQGLFGRWVMARMAEGFPRFECAEEFDKGGLNHGVNGLRGGEKESDRHHDDDSG